MKAFIERSTRHCTRCAKALYRGWIRRFANRRCSRHCSASSDIVLQYMHTAFMCSGFPDQQTGPQPTGKTPPTPSDFLQLTWPSYMAIFFCRPLELCTFANTGKTHPSDFCSSPSFYAQHLCSADSCVALFSVPEVLPESP